MKTKVLIVSNSYAGESRLTNLFVTSLDKDKYEVLVCYLKGKSEVPDTLDKMGVSYYLLSKRGKANFETITKLGVLLKEFRPDIIHCHRFDSTLVGTLASFFYGVGKVISHVHGLNRIRGLRRKLIAKWMLRRLALTVCVSEFVRQDVINVNSFLDKSSVKVLHNAIDAGMVCSGKEYRDEAKANLGLSENTFNIVNVGRLVPTKGQKYLIEGFAAALKKNNKLRLYFIGDGRLKSELEEQVRELGLDGKVFFCGYRKDILNLLCGFDLFAFSSLAEGLPLSIVEAMYAELPVVTTSAGGLPEVFGSGGFGNMVDIASSEQLAAAILEISLMDDGNRKALGLRARERAEEGFSKEVLRRNLIDIYNQVLSENN